MALIVNTTPLDSAQNSYASLAQMESYVNDRCPDPAIATAWDNLDSGQRAAYLVNATRSLDSACTWIGDQYSRDQQLKWPRVNAWVENFLLDVLTTPKRVMEATCEMAIWSMQNSGAVSVQNTEEFERIWVGPIKLNVNTHDGYPAISYFPDVVAYLLKDLAQMNTPNLPGGNSVKQAHLSRL